MSFMLYELLIFCQSSDVILLLIWIPLVDEKNVNPALLAL